MAGNRSRRKTLSFGQVLLILAGALQGCQYVYASVLVHDNFLQAFAIGGGILFGLVVTSSIAFTGGRLPLIRSQRARTATWYVFLAQLMISPILLTFINWFTTAPALKASIGWAAWLVAAGMASFPDLIMAGVAFSDRALLPSNSASTGVPLRSKGVERDSTPRSRRSKTPATAKSFPCNVPGCGFVARSQQGLAGHIGQHNRKDRSAGLAGDLFKNVKGADDHEEG